MFRFMVTMSRDAEEEDELSLKAGDVVYVDMAHEVNKDEKNGWYIAVHSETNVRGLVPTFCVRAISVKESSNKDSASTKQKEDDKIMSPEKRPFPFVKRPDRTISNFTLHDLDLYDELSEKGWVVLNLMHESSHRVEENDLLEVDYTGYIWDGGSTSIEMYLDTRSKKTPTWIEVSNHSSCAVSGLVSALRTMRIGQTADLVIAPQQAYGERGNLRLGVSPNVHLVIKNLRIWRKVRVVENESSTILASSQEQKTEDTETASLHVRSTSELQEKVLPVPHRHTEPKILRRLQQLIEDDGEEEKNTTNDEKDGLHKVTYQHVRDSLVREFGRASFNLNKRLIQKALLEAAEKRLSPKKQKLRRMSSTGSTELRCASTPGTGVLKEGELMKTFGRLGTWVVRTATLTEGYLEYNSGWYHRHSVSARRRRINFGEIESLRTDTAEEHAFFVQCRNREKPYHFKGTGWFEAISDAWKDFKRVYCNVTKIESPDFALKEMQSSFAEVAGGGRGVDEYPRLSAKVRRATVNSLKRKEENGSSSINETVKWA